MRDCLLAAASCVLILAGIMLLAVWAIAWLGGL